MTETPARLKVEILNRSSYKSYTLRQGEPCFTLVLLTAFSGVAREVDSLKAMLQEEPETVLRGIDIPQIRPRIPSSTPWSRVIARPPPPLPDTSGTLDRLVELGMLPKRSSSTPGEDEIFLDDMALRHAMKVTRNALAEIVGDAKKVLEETREEEEKKEDTTEVVMT